MAVSIVSISPTTGSVGVSLHESIKVVFSTAIDPTSVGPGTFFVEGSDRDVISGPFVPINFQGTSVDVLSDPAYFGLVKGSCFLEYLETDGVTELPSTFEDTSGTLEYYTRITFVPDRPLSPLHPYKVYLSGTSSDQENIGIHSRTLFDPIPAVGNVGLAEIFPRGAYKEAAQGTYTVDILSDGVVGSATYRWRFNAEAYSPTILTHSYSRQMKHGVAVAFDLENDFKSGDSYQFIAKPREFLASINISNFVTGDQGTQVLPNDPNSLVSQLAPPFIGVAQPGFGLHHTMPYNMQCDIDTNTTAFRFYFNKDVSTTFDTNGFQIYIGPANGDTCIREETSYTPNHVEVENGTCLVVFLENT